MAGFAPLGWPRVVAGVGLPFFVVNLGVAAEAFLVTGSWLALPIALATHAGGWLARQWSSSPSVRANRCASPGQRAET